VLATLRSFLAGIVSPGDSASPAGALQRIPHELRKALGGVLPRPLDARLGERPHYRYAAGDGRLLHVYVSPTQELVDSVSADGAQRVLSHVLERDALWVLERDS
jgi:hypothetical protein